MTQILKDLTAGKTIRQVLAENLKTLMARHKGMTVASLSRESGVSRGQISNILTQKSATTTDTLESLGDILGVQPSLLLYVRPDGASYERTLDIVESRKTDDPITPEDRDTSHIRELVGENGKKVFVGSDFEMLAIQVFTFSFLNTDDEGKASLLRHAAAESGIIPSTVGVKLPRDWRDVVPIMWDANLEKIQENISGLRKRSKEEKKPF